MSKTMLSWGDRFALIDHYNPTDNQVCSAFGLTQDELDTARSLRDAGTFAATLHFDCGQHATIFSSADNMPTMATIPVPVGGIASPVPPAVVAPRVSAPKQPTEKTTQPTHRQPTATVHTKPETASRRVKEPQKRGRKGDKISKAFAAVPMTQIPVDAFIVEHGVSLAVLRQSKRFLAAMEPAVAQSIGRINVRQDKDTKQLMIWREVDTTC